MAFYPLASCLAQINGYEKSLIFGEVHRASEKNSAKKKGHSPAARNYGCETHEKLFVYFTPEIRAVRQNQIIFPPIFFYS